MNIDLVFPRKNENAFLKVAESLGYDILIFAYEKKEEVPLKKITHEKIKVMTACNEKARNADMIIAKHSEQDRNVIEKREVSVLYDLETEKRKDFLHQRASGFNHIHAALCREKKVKILFSHNIILKAKNRGQILGRMMQNIWLCRKYKVPFALASCATSPLEMRAPHDLKALGIILGMHPS